MSDLQNNETGSGSSKRRTLLLIVSLAFNIFFVGTVVGGAFVGNRIHERAQSIRHAPPIHSFANPRKVMRYADAEHHDTLRAILKSEMKALRPLLKDVGQKRTIAMESLSATPFSEEASQKAFADLAEAESSAHRASSQTLVKMLQALPEEDRAELVAKMSEYRHERGRHDRSRDKWRERRDTKGKE